MKQTAIEELITYFKQPSKHGLWCVYDLLAQLYEAKEKEKEQIRDAFNSGMNNSVDYFIPFLNPNDESENYYNETFKSE
jgi:hypothetical protein